MTTATAPPATLDYAGPTAGLCPLCHERPVWKKPLYGHPVCKKCLYKLANRRQVAYLVDAVLFFIPTYALMFAVGTQLARQGLSGLPFLLATTAIGLPLNVLFVLKDGLGGRSPGKRLTGVVVVDDATGRPISFGQSFKRNAVLLVGVVPYVGGVLSFVVVVTIVVQMTRGPRLGDRFAGTRVVWRRYADSPVFGGDGALCERCGYDLTGNESGRCPECGEPAGERQPVGPAAAR